MSASGPLTASSTTASSYKDTSHSPPPLAPLVYLQTHPRGSITDPSLHAAPMNSSVTLNTNYRQIPLDHLGSASSASSSAHHDSSPKNHLSDPRPVSTYVFGDATPHITDNSPQIRNLLRSPSIEPNHNRSSLSHEGIHLSADVTSNGSVPTKSGGATPHLNLDSERPVFGRRSSREQPQFDYSMRRHSIAVGQDPPHMPQGTKRKMSTDRSNFAAVGEEIDPQLAGPGIPSVMDIDTDTRASKRRGSAIDTQRIAQLSLNDRRNSVDSRGPSQWWMNDRRDSTSSLLSNVSSSYSSGFTGGDSPHGRTPSSPWTHPQDPSGSTPMPADVEPNSTSGVSRSFDPTTSMSMMPAMNFAPDRRMSVPDTLISNVPRKVLRSRSRPPSRQRSNADSNTQSGPSSGQDESASPTTVSKQIKESGTAPYARSPELRVSHKLAERKRRKEMKDLFDELRDQLPADRGMKASKWEILSKAIDFVAQLKQSHQEMAREIEGLRHELEATRQGSMPSFSPSGQPPHAMVYGQGPMPVSGQYPPSPSVAMQHQQLPTQPPASSSRPGSSQNVIMPTNGSSAGPTSRNGNVNRMEPS